MWVRGLKHGHHLHLDVSVLVAPYVGAWIETSPVKWKIANVRSHPMWVRGLKHLYRAITCRTANVAPYVGAWIET